jgi:hypothetical protein
MIDQKNLMLKTLKQKDRLLKDSRVEKSIIERRYSRKNENWMMIELKDWLLKDVRGERSSNENDIV